LVLLAIAEWLPIGIPRDLIWPARDDELKCRLGMFWVLDLV
jgi:hypothetical protein